MTKEKISFNKITTRILAISMCAIMTVSCMGINAFAADNRYTFQTDYSGSGENWWLDTSEKEYTDITVSCGKTSAHAKMSLWKSWIFGDVHYDQDQTITVGRGRRIWWFGDQANDAHYHVTADVSDNYGKTVSFSGYFQNFYY